MKKHIKLLLPDFLLDYRHKKRIDEKELSNYLHWREKGYNQWVTDGKPLPPPHAVKQRVIHTIQNKYNISVLVETGTFQGDMLEAQKRSFKELYSIELSNELHFKAKKRFQYDRKITLVLGDSSVQLKKIAQELVSQSIFWLDGHYSGDGTAMGALECPVYAELDGVFSSKIKNHILLVDDERCFTGANSYPTKEELLEYVHKYNSNYTLKVIDDVIVLEP